MAYRLSPLSASTTDTFTDGPRTGSVTGPLSAAWTSAAVGTTPSARLPRTEDALGTGFAADENVTDGAGLNNRSGPTYATAPAAAPRSTRTVTTAEIMSRRLRGRGAAAGGTGGAGAGGGFCGGAAAGDTG